MAMDFTAMQTEVAARGFDYLTAAGGATAAQQVRIPRWINEAAHEIDSAEKWDYTYATSSGVAPLTIADLRLVEDVIVSSLGTPLPGQDRMLLESIYGVLTVAGALNPLFWFRSAPTVVTTYPLNTSLSLSVRYWKFGPDLSAGTDVPLMPDRFRQVIVERAVAKAFRDSNDQPAEAESLQEVDRLLDLMRRELVPDYLIRPPAQQQAAK
jgi:hypothetical protein